jgi:hypothetical protein
MDRIAAQRDRATRAAAFYNALSQPSAPRAAYDLADLSNPGFGNRAMVSAMTSAPQPPVVNSVALPNTGGAGPYYTISGTSVPGSVARLYTWANGVKQMQVLADEAVVQPPGSATGLFTFYLPIPAGTPGQYVVTAYWANDPSRTESQPSMAFYPQSFTPGPTGTVPQPPVMTSVLPPTTWEFGASYAINGTSVPGTVVRLYASWNGTKQYQVAPDAAVVQSPGSSIGYFTIYLPISTAAAQPGQYILTAYSANDPSKTESLPSPPFMMQWTAWPPDQVLAAEGRWPYATLFEVFEELDLDDIERLHHRGVQLIREALLQRGIQPAFDRRQLETVFHAWRAIEKEFAREFERDVDGWQDEANVPFGILFEIFDELDLDDIRKWRSQRRLNEVLARWGLELRLRRRYLVALFRIWRTMHVELAREAVEERRYEEGKRRAEAEHPEENPIVEEAEERAEAEVPAVAERAATGEEIRRELAMLEAEGIKLADEAAYMKAVVDRFSERKAALPATRVMSEVIRGWIKDRDKRQRS